MGKGKGGYGHRLLAFIPHVTVLATLFAVVSPKCVKVCSPSAQELLDPTLSFGHYCSSRGAPHRCFGREVMHQMLTPDDENSTLAWLEDALGQAYVHGQMTTLAYLEAVMEDVVFVMEMVRGSRLPLGEVACSG